MASLSFYIYAPSGTMTVFLSAAKSAVARVRVMQPGGEELDVARCVAHGTAFLCD